MCYSEREILGDKRYEKKWAGEPSKMLCPNCLSVANTYKRQEHLSDYGVCKQCLSIQLNAKNIKKYVEKIDSSIAEYAKNNKTINPEIEGNYHLHKQIIIR